MDPREPSIEYREEEAVLEKPVEEQEATPEKPLEQFLDEMAEYTTTLGITETEEMRALRTSEKGQADEAERRNTRIAYRALANAIPETLPDSPECRQAKLGVLILCACIKLKHEEWDRAYEELDEALTMATQDPEAFDPSIADVIRGYMKAIG